MNSLSEFSFWHSPFRSVGAVTKAGVWTLLLAAAALMPLWLVSDERGSLPPDRIFAFGFEGTALTGCSAADLLDEDGDGLLDPRCVTTFVPPNPTVTAKAVDPTIVTPFTEINDFLWKHPNPVQRGFQEGSIQRWRTAVLRGKVLDSAGTPLGGVLVRVLHRPEYGYTYSRADGMYDLMVNGGGELTIDFQKPGFLRAQRTADVSWNDWAYTDDVALVPLDTASTVVSFGPAVPQQLARGTQVTDQIGPRRATLIIPPGTIAELVDFKGKTSPISSATLRATEYTVGDLGPTRMPGELPPTVAYTYAVELGADEVIQGGYRSMRFSSPIWFYLENYRRLDVGQVVPVGSYDFLSAGWVGEPNGRIIKILSITGGTAVLDVTGNGQPATPAQLQALGLTADERLRLATLYPAGQELWRAPIHHLTPFDCNFPHGPPDGPPPAPPPEEGDCTEEKCPPPADDGDPPPPQDCTDDCNCPGGHPGSMIACPTGTVSERVSVPGLEGGLVYSGLQAPAASSLNPLRRVLKINLTYPTITPSLQRVSYTLFNNGHVSRGEFPPAPNLQQQITVPTADAYGRLQQGMAAVQICIAYDYQTNFIRSRADREIAWASYGVGPNANASALVSGELQLSECFNLSNFRFTPTPLYRPPYNFDALGQAFGGLRPAEHAVFDPRHRVRISGAGPMRLIDGPSSSSLKHVSFIPTSTQAITDFNVGSDGSLYYFQVDQRNGRTFGQIIRRRPGGAESVEAESCLDAPSSSGGGPGCEPGAPTWYANGGLYVLENGVIWLSDGLRLHRIVNGQTQGTVDTTLAGCQARDVLVRRNRLYIHCGSAGGEYLGVLESGGLALQRVVGGGQSVPTGNPQSALDIRIEALRSFSVDPVGGVIYTDRNRLVEVDRFGRAQVIYAAAGDVLLTAAHRTNDGTIYFSEGLMDSVVYAFRRGIEPVRVIGGGEGLLQSPNGGLIPSMQARNIRLPLVFRLLSFPDGSVALGTAQGLMFMRVGSFDFNGNPDPDRHLVSSADGFIEVFDRFGRHLETLDADTGGVLKRYQYDVAGRLVNIFDGNGNRTSIERNTTGRATAILDPDGNRTELTYDSRGFLARVSNPAEEAVAFEYVDQGRLLSRYIDARGAVTRFEYDTNGRLAKHFASDASVTNIVRKYGYSNNAVHSILTTPMQRQREDYVYNYRPRLNGFSSRSVNGVDGRTSWRFVSENGNITHYDYDRSLGDLQSSTRHANSFAVDPRFGAPARYVAEAEISLDAREPQAVIASVHRTQLRNRTAIPTVVGGGLGTVETIETVRINQQAAWTYRYTPSTRVYSVQSPAGRQSSREVDLQGRPRRVTAGILNPVFLDYDPRGRLQVIRSGTGANERRVELSYGPRGYLQSVTDPLKRTLQIETDPVGRPQRLILPDTREVRLRHDPNGNVLAIRPPGREEHQFAWNLRNRLREYRPPALSGISNPQTTYSYDLDQRLTGVQRPDPATLTLAHDRPENGGGLPSRVETPDGAWELYGRPQRIHRLVAPSVTVSSISYGLEQDRAFLGPLLYRERNTWIQNSQRRELDVVLNRNNELLLSQVRLVTPTPLATLGTVSYQYNADELLTRASSGSTRLDLSYRSDVALLAELQTYSQNVQRMTDRWTHDGFAELSRHEVRDGASPTGALRFAQDYQRDKLGRITRRTETLGSTVVVYDYTYDVAGRLEAVSVDGTEVSRYGFDSNGNRLSRVTPEGSVSGSYDAQDRMLSYGPCTYTYDGQGDTQSRICSANRASAADARFPAGETRYRYDVFSNLRRVETPDGRVIEYLIDGSNRRVGRLVNGQLTQRLVYKDQLEPIAEFDGAGQLKAWFIYADRAHVPTLMLKPENGSEVAYRLIADHLGSVRLVVRLQDGVVVQRIDYDEYGVVLSDSNPGFQPFGYAGGIDDREAGLVRFGARDYDPLTGRWLTKDPIGLADDLNLYAYVKSMPVSAVDPTGLQSYVCERPIRGAEQGLHSFLCTTNERGEKVCAGQGPKCGMLQAVTTGCDGKDSDEKFDADQCTEVVPKNRCVEKCFEEKFAEPRPRYAGVGPHGTDCFEWSEEVWFKCATECSEN